MTRMRSEPSLSRVVSLTELRFKPANSNDAARAVMSHHFSDVPRCSFAKDDGLWHYMGSETGINDYPVSPAAKPETATEDVPDIANDPVRPKHGMARKLLRAGFSLSVVLHAAAALAIGLAAITLPEDDAMMEGVTSVTLVVEGNSESDETASGAEEAVEAPVEKPDIVAPPVEPEPVVEEPQPVIPTAKDILDTMPVPQPLGADLPEILSTRETAETQVEAAAPPADDAIVEQPPIEAQPALPAEEKQQPVAAEAAQPLPHPVSRPKIVKKPAENILPDDVPVPVARPEVKPPEAKKAIAEKPEKKPREKTKQNKGNQGKRLNNAKRGDAEAKKSDQQASANSQGDSTNREIGSAARSNYKGMVQKKLQRAKGRVRSPGKGSVTVRFTIRSNGSIAGLAVARGSGKPALDTAALKVVQAAAPFPAIPADVGRKSMPFSLDINFR